jgi:hypothetical protein
VTQASRTRHAIPRAIVGQLFAEFGGTCLISDCPYPNTLPDGTPTLNVAHIISPHRGGRRGDEELAVDGWHHVSNLVLLCPAHHQVIDTLPEEYPADKLRMMRRWHVERVARILNSPHAVAQPTAKNDFEHALDVWNSERGNSAEEYWQQLLQDHPRLFAPTIPGGAFTISSKCYVGGKSLANAGGSVLDFLAQRNGDVSLIEIKSPSSRLLGGRYRTNVRTPSIELTGALVQALHYRLTLLKNLQSLQGDEPHLFAHNPSVVILIGDTEREFKERVDWQSFELFRSALRDVVVLTYDELFSRVSDIAAMLRGD